MKDTRPVLNAVRGICRDKSVRRADGGWDFSCRNSLVWYMIILELLDFHECSKGHSRMVLTQVLAEVMEELENAGSRSDLVNPHKESQQLNVVENGSHGT